MAERRSVQIPLEDGKEVGVVVEPVLE